MTVEQDQNGISMEHQKLLPADQELGVTINTNLDENEADWMVDIGSEMLSGQTVKRSDQDYLSYSDRDKYQGQT